MVRRKVFIILILLFIINVNLVIATTPKQRVYDYANLLEQAQVEKLETMAEKYSKRRETDFIILTTDNKGGKDVVKYMEDFYDEMELGYDRPHGNTAIITIDVEDIRNREVYLAGFYKGETYLDDYRLDLIRHKITPNLSKSEYYKAFSQFIKLGQKYMGMEPNVDPNNILFNLWFQIIVSLGIAGVVVGGMAYSSGGKRTVSQGTYMDFSNSRIISRRDKFIRSTVTRRKKPSANKSSGGGFGGGVGGGGGTTSRGHSHSGSRGSF